MLNKARSPLPPLRPSPSVRAVHSVQFRCCVVSRRRTVAATRLWSSAFQDDVQTPTDVPCGLRRLYGPARHGRPGGGLDRDSSTPHPRPPRVFTTNKSCRSIRHRGLCVCRIAVSYFYRSLSCLFSVYLSKFHGSKWNTVSKLDIITVVKILGLCKNEKKL